MGYIMSTQMMNDHASLQAFLRNNFILKKLSRKTVREKAWKKGPKGLEELL